MASRWKILVAVEDDPVLREVLRAAVAVSLEAIQLRDPQQVPAVLLTHRAALAFVIGIRWRGQRAADLLQKVRAIDPKFRRIVVTDPSDLAGVVDGLHNGAIDSTIYRPVDPKQLLAAATGTAAPRTAPRAQPHTERRVSSHR